MLNHEEKNRYLRQLMLPGIGEEGQIKLKNARVLIAGAGGLGSPVSLYLTAAGVGTIGLADDDTVALSNLQRQVLYNSTIIGESKTAHAKKIMNKLNPNVTIHLVNGRISEQNATEIISQYDIVVDATDNFRSRYLISKFCQELDKPMVYGSIEEFSGQVAVFNYKGGPVYEDLFPEPPANTPLDGEPKGVFGALPGIIGSLQSMEVLKIITGIGKPLNGKLLTYNALTGSFNTFLLQE